MPPPPAPPPPAASTFGDPHLYGPYGGQTDFHGIHKHFFAFLSAPGLSVNVLTQDADFRVQHGERDLLVHGSFLTQVGIVVKGTEGLHRQLRLSFWADVHNRNLRFQRSGWVQYVCGTRRKPVWLYRHMTRRCDGALVEVATPSLTVTTNEWQIKVSERNNFWEKSVDQGGEHDVRKRLDVQITPRVADPRRPHGLLGQWFAAKAPINGTIDTLPLTGEYTTQAQAEGAIQGTIHDYVLEHRYATEFTFSRFSALDDAKVHGLNTSLTASSNDELYDEMRLMPMEAVGMRSNELRRPHDSWVKPGSHCYAMGWRQGSRSRYRAQVVRVSEALWPPIIVMYVGTEDGRTDRHLMPEQPTAGLDFADLHEGYW